MPRTTILLTRHGETDYNRDGRYQGSRSDPPLNECGHAQARILGQSLSGKHIDAVYSSPASRALSTAQAIVESASLTSLAVQPLDDLREGDFGDWEGLTYEQIDAGWHDHFETWISRPATVAPPGGETLAEVAVRAWEVILGFETRHTAKTVLIVSHGGLLRVVLSKATGLPIDNCMRFNQGHCNLNILYLYDGFPYVELWNSSGDYTLLK